MKFRGLGVSWGLLLGGLFLSTSSGATLAARLSSQHPGVSSGSESINRTRRTILQARSYIKSRRTDSVESLLFDATSTLASVPESHKASLLSEISQFRSELATTIREEDTRRIT